VKCCWKNKFSRERRERRKEKKERREIEKREDRREKREEKRDLLTHQFFVFVHRYSHLITAASAPDEGGKDPES